MTMKYFDLLDLPNDLIEVILKYLQFDDYLNCFQVNKRIQKLTKKFLWEVITDDHTNFYNFEDLVQNYGHLVKSIDILYWMEDTDLAKFVEYTPNLEFLNCELKSLEELITISVCCPKLKSSRLCLKDIENEFDVINPLTNQSEDVYYPDKLPIKLETLNLWNSQGPIYALDFLDLSSITDINLQFYDELTPKVVRRILTSAPLLSKLSIVLGVPNGGNFEVDVSDVIYEFKRPLPNLEQVSLQFAGWNLMNVSHFKAVIPFNPKMLPNLTHLKLGLSTSPPEDEFLKELCARYLNDLINQNWTKLTTLSTFCASEDTIEILGKPEFETLEDLEIMCVLNPSETLNSLMNSDIQVTKLTINEADFDETKLEFTKDHPNLKSLTFCRNNITLPFIEFIMNCVPNLEELLLLQAPLSDTSVAYIKNFESLPNLAQLCEITFGNCTSEYFRSSFMPRLNFAEIQKLVSNSPELILMNLWQENSKTIDECKEFVKMKDTSFSICVVVPVVIRHPFGSQFTFKSHHITNYLDWECGHIHPSSSRLNFP